MIKTYYRVTVYFEDGDIMELLIPFSMGTKGVEEAVDSFDFVKRAEIVTVYDMRSI